MIKLTKKRVSALSLFLAGCEKAYPVSYDETLTVATNEKNGKDRPKFKGKVENIEQYENVFIGGPIWWGEPPIVHSLLLSEIRQKATTCFLTCIFRLRNFAPSTKTIIQWK